MEQVIKGELNILQVPNPILYKKSEGEGDIEDLRVMLKFVENPANKAIGLALPQIGKNQRGFVVSYKTQHQKFRGIFNDPVIKSHSDKMNMKWEECLSEPGKRVMVKRYDWVKLEYHNGEERKTRMFDGYTSRIIQHEMNHLDGILLEHHQHVSGIQYASTEAKSSDAHHQQIGTGGVSGKAPVAVEDLPVTEDQGL